MAGARETRRNQVREQVREQRAADKAALEQRRATAATRAAQRERNEAATAQRDADREHAQKLNDLASDRTAYRLENRSRELAVQGEQRERNEQAAKALAGPGENKAIIPADENKSDADPLDGVELTPAAERRARELKLNAESFKRRRRTGATGFTVDDVERIAASIGAEEETE